MVLKEPGDHSRREGGLTLELVWIRLGFGVMSLAQSFPDITKNALLTKVQQERESHLRDLRAAYREGLNLYIGAGVSITLGLPSWRKLISSLTVHLMSGRSVQQDGSGAPSSPTQILSLADLLHDKPLLPRTRAISNELGRTRLPGVVAQALYSSNPAIMQGRLPTPSPLVEALVFLVRPKRHTNGVEHIVNYNFDDLFEEILQAGEVPCGIIRSESDPQPEHTVLSFHVHGVLPLQVFRNGDLNSNPEVIGNLVFGEDQYHTEFSDPYRWSNVVQVRLLSSWPGLFVGQSLEDPNIRRLIDLVHRTHPHVGQYAIHRRSRPLSSSTDCDLDILLNAFERVETASLDSIGVKVIWVDNHDEIPEFIRAIPPQRAQA